MHGPLERESRQHRHHQRGRCGDAHQRNQTDGIERQRVDRHHECREDAEPHPVTTATAVAISIGTPFCTSSERTKVARRIPTVPKNALGRRCSAMCSAEVTASEQRAVSALNALRVGS